MPLSDAKNFLKVISFASPYSLEEYSIKSRAWYNSILFAYSGRCETTLLSDTLIGPGASTLWAGKCSLSLGQCFLNLPALRGALKCPQQECKICQHPWSIPEVELSYLKYCSVTGGSEGRVKIVERRIDGLAREVGPTSSTVQHPGLCSTIIEAGLWSWFSLSPGQAEFLWFSSLCPHALACPRSIRKARCRCQSANPSGKGTLNLPFRELCSSSQMG